MINHVDRFTLAQIFPVENPMRYIIPKFQRSYTWGKENWDAILTDIIESEDSHFIGSIICINQGTDTLNPELELIDGQQRLTTISLLFCAVYKMLRDKTGDDDEETRIILANLKSKLVKNSGELKLELSTQNNNLSDYRSVLNEAGVIDFTNHVNNKGNRIIFKCYRYFLKRLEEYTQQKLTEFLDGVNRTLLVKIEVNSHSDAFMLFESLNNRGIPLSAVDLIKNKMLAELEGRDIMNIDSAFDKWNTIVDNLPDYTIQERFLRQYYNAFKYEIKVEGVTKATRSNLIKIYENLIERSPENILTELIDKSNIYSNLVDIDSESEIFSEIKDELNDLINVKAAPAYTLLLFIFSNPKFFDNEAYRKIINFLVKYFIRRNITDFPNTRNLDQIFMDLIDEMRLDDKLMNAEHVIIFLSDKDRISSLDTFIERLNGDVYDLNVDATRFILSKIEESKSTLEIHTDFWERDRSNKLIWTIEHIFPEGRNIPDSWVEMMAEGNEVEAKRIQNDYVHKLGNLTLTGYNQNLSNFDFKKKKERKKDGNFIGYKNRLFLNEDLKDKESWVENDIIERTKKVVDLAINIFKIENES